MKQLSIRLSLISLFIFACAGIGAPSSASDLTAAPNPLTVKDQIDSDRASTAPISIDGGTLSATAADGTRFTLTLPKDALAQDTDITLTPVTQIDGLPLDGGLVAAVKIEPDGLDLLLPATLTIDLSSQLPSDDLLTVGFAYRGNGTEFHLTPSSIEGQSISYSLYHFSGHGSGRGTKANVKKQKKDHPPTKPQDRLEQESSDLLEQVSPVESFRDQYVYKVGPQIQAAVEAEKQGGDAADASLTAALQTFRVWLHEVEAAKLTPLFAKEIDAGYRFLVQAIKYALDDACKRCVEKDDIEQSLRMEKWLVILLFLPDQYTRDTSAYVTQLDKCHHHFALKIQFTSDNGNANGSTQSHSEAQAPIILQRGGIFTGEGTGTQTITSGDTASGCTETWEQSATWQARGILDTDTHVLETSFVEVLGPYEEPAFCGINGRGTVPGVTIPVFMDELTVAFPIPTQAGETLLLTPFYVGKGNVSLTLLAID